MTGAAAYPAWAPWFVQLPPRVGRRLRRSLYTVGTLGMVPSVGSFVATIVAIVLVTLAERSSALFVLTTVCYAAAVIGAMLTGYGALLAAPATVGDWLVRPARVQAAQRLLIWLVPGMLAAGLLAASLIALDLPTAGAAVFLVLDNVIAAVGLATLRPVLALARRQTAVAKATHEVPAAPPGHVAFPPNQGRAQRRAFTIVSAQLVGPFAFALGALFIGTAARAWDGPGNGLLDLSIGLVGLAGVVATLVVLLKARSAINGDLLRVDDLAGPRRALITVAAMMAAVTVALAGAQFAGVTAAFPVAIYGCGWVALVALAGIMQLRHTIRVGSGVTAAGW